MISVALATYNGELFLEKQLDSIINQTYPVDEIIIVDDCSTDNTVNIIKRYVNDYSKNNIHFYQNSKNQGYKRNFRNALNYCTGDYIFLSDQDDVWENDKVEKMLDTIQSNSKILALASSFSFIDQNDIPFEVKKVEGLSNNNLLRRVVKPHALVEITFDEFLIQNSFQGCALLLKKELKEKFINCFTDEIFHDWLINLLASEKSGMYFLNEPLFKYRIHGKNTIGINEQEVLSTKERLLKTNTLHIRTEFAKASIDSLNILEMVDDELIKNQPNYKEKKLFYQNHIEYLTNGNVIKLLLQNLNPYYKNIKTNRARIMDLFFALKQKLNLFE